LWDRSPREAWERGKVRGCPGGESPLRIVGKGNGNNADPNKSKKKGGPDSIFGEGITDTKGVIRRRVRQTKGGGTT